MGQALSITNIINDYQGEYTEVTKRRTMPQNNTLPEGLALLLHAIGLESYSQKGYQLVVPTAAYGEISKVTKAPNGGLHENLAGFTSAPHPLVESIIVSDPDKIVTQAANIQQNPIKSLLDGRVKSERYTRVRVSELGDKVFRHYKDMSLAEFYAKPYHNCIIPVSLIKPGNPITLGYGSSWLPLNPRELLLLQLEMLKAGTADLSHQIVQEIFKGPDVGDNYIIHSTNEGLASLYKTGSAKFRITPRVEVNMDKGRGSIVFKAPPYQSNFMWLRDYLRGLAYKGKFKTMIVKHENIKVLGSKVVIQNIDFLTPSESEVLTELFELTKNDISKLIVTKASCCKVHNMKEHDTHNQVDIIRKVYEIDIVNIPEVLWDCITQEIERKKDDLKKQIKALEESMKELLLMQKLTVGSIDGYRDIRDVISEVWQIPNIGVNGRVNELLNRLKTFVFHPSLEEHMTKFSRDEVEAIYARQSRILPTLYDGTDWALQYKAAVDEINALTAKLNNDLLLREELYQEITNWLFTNRNGKVEENGKWARKSIVYFDSQQQLDFRRVTLPPRSYDTLQLPVTYFFDYQSGVVKSYGRNMNVTLEHARPCFALNALANEMVTLHLLGGAADMKSENISAVQWSSIQQGDIIRGILPVPKGDEKIMVLSAFPKDHQGNFIYMYSCIDNHNHRYLDLKSLDTPALGMVAIVIAWDYVKPEGYLDILTSAGVVRIDMKHLDLTPNGEFRQMPNIATNMQDIEYVSPENKDKPVIIPSLRSTESVHPIVSDITEDGGDVKFTMRDQRNQLPYLGNHYEMYLDALYLPDPSEYFVVDKYLIDREKYMTITEFTPERGDTKSKRRNSVVSTIKDIVVDGDVEEKLIPIKAYCSSAYRAWIPMPNLPLDKRVLDKMSL